MTEAAGGAAGTEGQADPAGEGVALFDALFAPRAIALLGASGDPRKNTARPQRFLRRHGWTGRIHPVNRGRDECLGERAYPDLDSVPGPLDHAFVMLPAAQVHDALEACGRRRVPVVTVYSDGFAEAGPEGAANQRALADRARELGIRLLGPNCIGLIDVVGRMPLTVNATLEGELLPAGRVAVVSQSGSMLGTLLSRGQARGTGFSRLVSVGNEADLGVGELAGMLVDDPHTDVVLLFLETLRDAPRLALAARAAHAAGKAIVAYKLGRSSAGAQLAVSHTGAIAGEDAAFDAYFAAHGILRVDLLDTLLEIAPLLAGVRPKPGGTASRSPRIAVVSTTGGGAAMVVDRLGLLGVDPVAPPEPFISAMAAQGVPLRSAPVIDLTLAATPHRYSTVLRGLLESDFCDAVLAVAGSSAQFQPALAVDPIAGVAGERAWDKPLAVFLAPQADESLARLALHRVAAFRTPEACADALAARLRWRAPRSLDAAAPPELQSLLDGHARPPRGDDRRPASDGSGRRVLDESQSLAVVEAAGVPTVERALLRDEHDAQPIGWPVAAKLVSCDLPHKTEAGAVTLAVPDAAALAVAIRTMRERARRTAPDARIEGVLVQRMAKGMAEALLGYRHDPQVGPIVVLGVGGRDAELHRDASVRVAPVDLSTAHEMIAEVRGLAPVRGWRGQPPGDLAALAGAVVAMSRLAAVDGQPVLEAEVNPLIVGSEVVAVDALVVLQVAAEDR